VKTADGTGVRILMRDPIIMYAHPSMYTRALICARTCTHKHTWIIRKLHFF